jgi:hypothetical protein
MDEDAEFLVGEPILLQLLSLTVALTLGILAGLSVAAILSESWVDTLARFAG